MATQKRVLVPASPENILSSHGAVIVVILCGVAILMTTLGLCMYGYVKFRRAKKKRLGKEIDREKRKESIVHLGRVMTNETTGSKASDDTLPRWPINFRNEYGMVGFGNCRTSDLESIAGNFRGVLPGEVVLPENGASTARNIRDTSAVLTPPRTPDKSRLPSIQHWSQPIGGYPGPTEPLGVGDTDLEVPPPLTVVHKNGEKYLPNPPLSRGRRIKRWDEVKQPLFGTVKRASIKRRGWSKNRWNKSGSESPRKVDSPIGLGEWKELKTENWGIRAREERYKNRNRVDDVTLEGLKLKFSSSHQATQLESETAVETVEADEHGGMDEGYRESIISAYDRDTDDSSDYGESESYLWKPLPKPPVEGS